MEHRKVAEAGLLARRHQALGHRLGELLALRPRGKGEHRRCERAAQTALDHDVARIAAAFEMHTLRPERWRLFHCEADWGRIGEAGLATP